MSKDPKPTAIPQGIDHVIDKMQVLLGDVEDADGLTEDQVKRLVDTRDRINTVLGE